MQIRIAETADIAGMHRVRLAVRENALSSPDRVRPADYEPLIGPDGRGWVAVDDDAIVGFAVGDLVRCNVWALFVDPGCEGRGIGRRLHDVMMDWLFASGAERVWLTTAPGTRAEGFYRTAGWRFVGIDGGGEARFEMAADEWAGRAARPIFHLSFPVSSLAATTSFYAACLGAETGRVHAGWADIVLFGHQLTVHELPDQVLPRASRGVRHFGAILGWEAWQRAKDQALGYDPALAAGVSYREVGTAREHAKLLLEDPDGNLIELKAYRDVGTVSGALGTGG